MNKYIGFLRGINVSGQKKIRMEDLRSLLGDAGLNRVQTYIQSGNVVFQSAEGDRRRLTERIENSIRKSCGFEVPVLLKSIEELGYIIRQHPFPGDHPGEENRIFTAFLYQKPGKEETLQMQSVSIPGEHFRIEEDFIFLYYPGGIGKAKLSNNYFEKKLKVKATTRNWKTQNILHEMAIAL